MERPPFASWIALAGLLAPSIASADTTREVQGWSSAAFTAKVTTWNVGPSFKDFGLSAWLDLHARRGPASVLGIVRPALGLRITPDVSVWAGYAWIPTYLDEGEPRLLNEHRPWQQVLYQGTVGPLSLQLRPRFEQRVREGQSDVAFRLRFFGRFNARLTQRIPLWFASTDEVFVALNDAAWGPKAGYDQNRLFLGLGYGTTPRVEAGYLSVVIRKPSLLQVEDNVAVNVFFSF